MLKIYVVPEDDSMKAKTKAWLKNRWTDIKCFWDENKEIIVTLTPVVVGGITYFVRVVGKRRNLMLEKDLKEKFVWDNRLGHYWEVKHKLTGAQWTEIERRKKNGEAIGEILRSMGVLKM